MALILFSCTGGGGGGGGVYSASQTTLLDMKRLIKPNFQFFVLLCALCFQRQPFRFLYFYVLQHQMFNMIEKHPQAGYWGKENFGDRMVDMLRDCENVLRKGKLPNHFKKYENILDRKDSDLLNQLADHFQRQREYLENM